MKRVLFDEKEKKHMNNQPVYKTWKYKKDAG
jgi:hypothetical protein